MSETRGGSSNIQIGELLFGTASKAKDADKRNFRENVYAHDDGDEERDVVIVVRRIGELLCTSYHFVFSSLHLMCT